MELQTKRLILRKATIQDANFIFNLLNSPGWLEFIGDRNVRTLKDARLFIDTALEGSFKEFGYGLLLMEKKQDGQPVGLCGLLKRSFFDVPDLGFAVDPEFVRQGYTYEASKRVLAYANQALEIERVLAFTKEKNLASQKLLMKLNMTLVEKKFLAQYDEVCWIYSQ